MPYKIQWYIENHIMYANFWGETTVEELRRCLKEVNALINQSDRPLVHIIIDVTRLTKPLSLVGATHAVVGYTPNPRTGWSLSIGEQDKLVRFVSDITRQILKRRQRYFMTLEEALAFLKDMDTSIDWDQANAGVLVQPSSTQDK